MTANVLSFDVEDWFHILDNESTKTEKEWSAFPSRLKANVARILESLERAKVTGTFFCLGWVARNYPAVIREIHSAGHEIGCHSDRHQLVNELGFEHFRDDLRNALGSLEDVLGSRVVAYRAPGFSVTAREAPWFFEALGELGIQYDCSILVARHGHGGFPEFPSNRPCKVRWSGGTIREFPLSPASVFGARVLFSGGGYFRLAPYPVIRWLAHRQQGMMTYFHPRDFDAHQPVVPGLSIMRRFKSYYGLRGAMRKLDRLLAEFRFVDLQTAARSIDWATTPEVSF
jgi:peptidoglycan-N-acetylglucosamine deacetylase